MKKIFLFYALLSIVLISNAQQEKLRVAVLDPTTSGIAMDEGTKLAVQELISSTMVNTGRFIIIERSMIDKIIKEQAFQNGDMADNSQATEIGKLAGANKVVLSAVSLVGGRNMLSIKIIDVLTASVDKQKAMVVNNADLLDVVEPMTLEVLGEKAVYPQYNKVAEKRESSAPQKNTTNNRYRQSEENSHIPSMSVGQVITFDDGTRGVVFYIEGNHGLAVSLDEATCAWQRGRGRDLVDIAGIPNNEDDDRVFERGRGEAYTKSIASYGGVGSSFSAASWCMSHGNGWYLPSAGELVYLFKIANATGSINRAIMMAGGRKIDGGWYWSSSEVDRKEAINISSGGSSSGEEKQEEISVRAMRAF